MNHYHHLPLHHVAPWLLDYSFLIMLSVVLAYLSVTAGDCADAIDRHLPWCCAATRGESRRLVLATTAVTASGLALPAAAGFLWTWIFGSALLGLLTAAAFAVGYLSRISWVRSRVLIVAYRIGHLLAGTPGAWFTVAWLRERANRERTGGRSR